MLTITNQEIFNKAWQAFIVEKRKPAYQNGECLYRGPNGSKCAIGLCIPDELYDPDFEGLSAEDLEDAQDIPIRFENPEFAVYAQENLHDNVRGLLGSDIPNYRDQLRATYIKFAKRFDLDIPENC